MKKVRLLIISIIMIVLIICGFKMCERGKIQSQNEIVKKERNKEQGKKAEGKKTKSEKLGDNILKENKKLIMDNIGIDDDCAQGIVDELNRLKIKKLISIKDYTKGKKGYTFSVKDEKDQVYYIGLGVKL
ncbi:hypothetical protein [Anaeromicropila herbilytica]|uniref:Uncharacterized protein n=1 Tax=Anaeromicropila herbilytica TaxID=2785025 RepID=A0A7R7EMW4_9FIRM|nr:hypothetical protein [Anaeromicropila herbilytica]BCN31885.1 hypothetical protein bsdtb5_31800 [Anaeromicropila herbilytica]